MIQDSGVAAKKNRRRLYDILSVICLLIGAGTVAYRFGGAVVYRPQKVTDEFHKLLYNSANQTWGNNRWLGVQVEKNPFDLWVLQEIIYETKPDVIVEAGTWKGGSALFMATHLDLIHHGKIVTIDIEKQPDLPVHPRIQYLLGSSTAPDIVDKVKSAIGPNDKVMVVLDSDHRKDHVLKELEIYSRIVTKGSYLILEDTNVNGHPVWPDFGPGPMEALQEYMRGHSDLEIDKSREKFFVTFNPSGYLQKVKN
jgi:cephalosporin hydroxylase